MEEWKSVHKYIENVIGIVNMLVDKAKMARITMILWTL
jgi:hypothetical protein